jgi:hypothetical protein
MRMRQETKADTSRLESKNPGDGGRAGSLEYSDCITEREAVRCKMLKRKSGWG